jgi:hypothetical protein
MGEKKRDKDRRKEGEGEGKGASGREPAGKQPDEGPEPWYQPESGTERPDVDNDPDA